MAVRRWIRVGTILSVVLVAAALAPCSDSDEPSSDAPERSATVDIFTSMSGRERNSCPTAAPFQQAAPDQPLTATLGPVVMLFPADSIDRESRVRADFSSRFNGLVLKVPMSIQAEVGTPVALRGSEITSGHALKYENYGTEGEYVEKANFVLKFAPGTSSFVPGAMLFPEPGCYQIFVTVDGAEYGPFGLQVSRVS